MAGEGRGQRAAAGDGDEYRVRRIGDHPFEVERDETAVIDVVAPAGRADDVMFQRVVAGADAVGAEHQQALVTGRIPRDRAARLPAPQPRSRNEPAQLLDIARDVVQPPRISQHLNVVAQLAQALAQQQGIELAADDQVRLQRQHLFEAAVVGRQPRLEAVVIELVEIWRVSGHLPRSGVAEQHPVGTQVERDDTPRLLGQSRGRQAQGKQHQRRCWRESLTARPAHADLIPGGIRAPATGCVPVMERTLHGW